MSNSTAEPPTTNPTASSISTQPTQPLSNYTFLTKKRKLNNLLSQLTDPNITISADTLALAKKRKLQRQRSVHRTPSQADLLRSTLPGSRDAFLARLRTFKDITRWSVPSTCAVNASIWAKRGWQCIDNNTVLCAVCQSRVGVDLDVSESYALVTESLERDGDEEGETRTQTQEEQVEEREEYTSALYEALVRRYEDMVVSSHTESCPWRKRGCDPTVQRIEGLLNVQTALSGLKDRYRSILRSTMTVPAVLELPSPLEEHHNIQELLEVDKPANGNAVRLAVCGWSYKDQDVLECHYCFRNLGLWLYRSTDSTPAAIDGLNALESHLEYCPWRNPVAQSSKVHDRQLAGWELVMLAVERQSGKRNGSCVRVDHDDSVSVISEQSVQERDAKIKDLIRRAKSVKATFNVKGLLRKKP